MKLSRRELYELVWSKPVEQAAKEFGISGRGLSKICERHRIPTPPRGYWAKLAAGQHVKKAILRDLDEPLINNVVIESPTANLPDEALDIIREAKAKKLARPQREISPPSIDQVEFTARTLHKSVEATVNMLRKRKIDASGSVRAVGPGLCGVVIHADRVERTASILNALALDLEAHGYDLHPDGERMKVAVGPDHVSFTLMEVIRREQHTPTEKELQLYEQQQARRKRAAERGDWGLHLSLSYEKPWPEFDLVHTGKLALAVDSWAPGLRKTWADGKIQRIERMLEDIVAGIRVILTDEKSRRERREEEDRIRAEMARRRDLSKKRKVREEQRVAYLSTLMQRRREAAELKDWLASISTDSGADQSAEASRMLLWVRERLADIEAHINLRQGIAGPDGGSLFPEEDDLHDPLGEPPEARGYF